MLEGAVYGLGLAYVYSQGARRACAFTQLSMHPASNVGTYKVVAIMSGQPKPLWASDLHPVGLHYYAGVVESAEELLEKQSGNTVLIWH